MAIKENPGDQKTRTSLLLVISSGLCLIFYLLGAWHRSGPGKGDSIAIAIAQKADCTTDLLDLNVETHHDMSASIDESETRNFEPCADNFTDYTPCQDQRRAMTFPRGNMVYRERHCPPDEEKIYCLIPAPKGYVAPFQWPKSRDYAAYVNVPYKSLTVEKAIQNWVQFQGNVFRFPGGGTQFPKGADNYIDQLSSVVPISDGTVRTVLDTGCGVASLGAYLLGRNVLTMSFAPRDSHEAQVQFALERGVPAVIGVLGSITLPYPSRAFDMAHCSRCLIPWGENGGMYLMEVDRVLRPGGYWVLSGPPINWRTNYEAWERTKEDLGEEQRKIEETAKLLCWEKVTEIAEIGIWRKRINADSCSLRKDQSRVSLCSSVDSDDVWYKEMEPCITRYPEVNSPDEVAGGELLQFPKRLNSVPARIASGSISGFTAESFQQYNKLWQKHVTEYKRVNKLLDSGRYRNIMDMNAGLGGFAATIESPKLWVMNVVPTISDRSTLGVIYERGLIGIYHDWCEAFSTYPRTYDLIHAVGVFSLYQGNIEREIEVHFGTVPVLNLGSFPDPCFSDENHFPNQHRCKMEDILLEMDRILRPEGAVIFRDNFNILIKVNKMVNGMRWKTKMTDHEDGSHMSEKILYAVKQYWVGGSESA